MGHNEERVDFPDLQDLLNRSFSDDKLEVIDYRATKLLPFGENYCSTMLKIEADVIRNSKEEKLHLVAKTGAEAEKYVLVWSSVFKKEVFLYKDLIPKYSEMQLDMCMNEKELFINKVPKFYGYRNSLNKDQDEADKDSVLLLENLKVLGYYTVDRRIGMNYKHAREALKNLSLYHVLGIALKQKHPEFFKIAKSQAQILGVHKDQANQLFDHLWEALRHVPFFAKHLDVIKSSFDFCKSKIHSVQPDEPWATITHGDFWCNNMMFHRDDKSGEIDDVKFCDFQMYDYQSPIRDLTYFLAASIDEETEREHYDDLLDCYYESFVSNIESLQCEGNFTRESFDAELKKQASRLFAFHIAIMKVVISNAKENKENDKNLTTVFEDKQDDIYMMRLARLVSIHERKNWF